MQSEVTPRNLVFELYAANAEVIIAEDILKKKNATLEVFLAMQVVHRTESKGFCKQATTYS